MSLPIARGLPRTVLRSYGTVQGPPSATSLAGRIPNVLIEATAATAPRTNWTREEISQVYNTPLNQLTYASVSVDLVADPRTDALIRASGRQTP
jgi:biotin synthase